MRELEPKELSDVLNGLQRGEEVEFEGRIDLNSGPGYIGLVFSYRGHASLRFSGEDNYRICLNNRSDWELLFKKKDKMQVLVGESFSHEAVMQTSTIKIPIELGTRGELIIDQLKWAKY